MKARVHTKMSKRVLATIWFIGTFVLVMLVVVQSLMGKYGNRTDDAFGWLLPTFMPTASLITGVLISDQIRHQPSHPVDPFVFLLTSILSSIYFLLVLLTILLAPFSQMGPLELMAMSNLWLGPVQGLVAGFMGVFFVQSRGTEEKGRATDQESRFEVVPPTASAVTPPQAPAN